MKPERPVEPQEVAALRSEIEAVAAAGRDRAAVGFAGIELQLEREPDGHYTLAGPERERSHVFVAAATSPDGYPADLPFIGNETVTWVAQPSGWTLAWLAPRSPESVIDQLHDYCLRAGWTLANETRTTVPESLQRMYRRGTEQRFLSSSSGMLALVHKNVKLF